MRDRGLKIATLFVEADKSGDGLISAAELADLLVSMTQPSVEVRQLRQKQKKAEAGKTTEDAAKTALGKKLEQNMKRAVDSGAFAALTALEAHMRRKQLRMQDVFAEIDCNGDGVISPAELHVVLRDVFRLSAVTKDDTKRLVECVTRERASARARARCADVARGRRDGLPPASPLAERRRRCGADGSTPLSSFARDTQITSPSLRRVLIRHRIPPSSPPYR